ncbi:rhomboid family intramembrane serine protease [Coprobacter tertius]|uniref:Rhomboid family intramembrane serine protease n=1 Tax=Coprobacter tertius TaxID=2944915 RepID=A0ABT1MFV4_9BACT|nr:rhomboid family intramembrane serine protease [Coprobacter tertius]MCP9611518.1 rhomboid family intramembrane serine protease [Coprobacter tertius]
MTISEPKRMVYALAFPAFFILLLWIVRVIEWEFGYDFSFLGIEPRRWQSLLHIFTYSFIHSGFSHLLANTIPLLVLGWILFLFYRDVAPKVVLWLWILSGIFTWLIGRTGTHIGASGLIYGLVFFLFFSGVFRKDFPLMAVSLVVVFLYGSILWNMFPVAEYIDPDVSWEGHLSGAMSGFILAAAFRPRISQREISEDDEEWPEWADPPFLEKEDEFHQNRAEDINEEKMPKE